MYENRREIMQDVFLTYLPARKFKTSRLTVNLITGLERAGASANALLPAVLSRGTVRHPDMESLSAAMDTLYGATVDSVVRKKGERQCIGFAADFIDDAFTPHGERLLEPVAELMGEMLLEPLTRNGSFLAEYVDSEKANLIDAIRSLRNDKRDWAEIRLMQEMCAGEPYSILRLGDEETAAKLNNHCLYRHSSTLLAGSRVEVLYCGSAERQRVEDGAVGAGGSAPGRGGVSAACGAAAAPGNAQGSYGGHGREPGQAGAGLPLHHGGCACHDPGQPDLRRHQQFQAVYERAGEAVPVLLRLQQLRPQQEYHDRLQRCGAEGL